jgi:protein SCO1/2
MLWHSMVSMVLGVSVLTSIGSAQVVRENPAELQKIDVVEHLGEPVPLDLVFTDESGRPMRLGDYFAPDQPVVLVMGYYRCPMLCNLVFNGLADGVGQLAWRPGQQFTIIIVSIDSTETPDLAAAKKANRSRAMESVDSLAGWHYLTGAADQSRALADAVGFKYYWDEGSQQWAHPAVVTLLSPDGTISRYLYGIEFPERDLRLGLLETSEGKIGNTIDRIILYCFHYDPQAGGYVVLAENVMRLGGVVTVAILGGLLALLWKRERRKRSARRAAVSMPGTGV